MWDVPTQKLGNFAIIVKLNLCKLMPTFSITKRGSSFCLPFLTAWIELSWFNTWIKYTLQYVFCHSLLQPFLSLLSFPCHFSISFILCLLWLLTVPWWYFAPIIHLSLLLSSPFFPFTPFSFLSPLFSLSFLPFLYFLSLFPCRFLVWWLPCRTTSTGLVPAHI